MTKRKRRRKRKKMGAFYDPMESRDYHGRWTSGGGGTTKGHDKGVLKNKDVTYGRLKMVSHGKHHAPSWEVEVKVKKK